MSSGRRKRLPTHHPEEELGADAGVDPAELPPLDARENRLLRRSRRIASRRFSELHRGATGTLVAVEEQEEERRSQ